jgi:hypothetical protein
MNEVDIMLKSKVISITHPRLIKVRNILREVLHSAALIEMKSFREKHSDLHYSTDLEKIKSLNDEESRFRLVWNQSICTCSLCGSRENNMTYNKNEDYWFCVNCYSLRHDFYEQKAREGQTWYDGGGRPSTSWFP